MRFPKNFEALPGFFSVQRVNKSLVELRKFLEFSQMVQILAHAKFQPIGQVVPSERAVISQWEDASRPIGTDCKLFYVHFWVSTPCLDNVTDSITVIHGYARRFSQSLGVVAF